MLKINTAVGESHVSGSCRSTKGVTPLWRHATALWTGMIFSVRVSDSLSGMDVLSDFLTDTEALLPEHGGLCRWQRRHHRRDWDWVSPKCTCTLCLRLVVSLRSARIFAASREGAGWARQAGGRRESCGVWSCYREVYFCSGSPAIINSVKYSSITSIASIILPQLS